MTRRYRSPRVTAERISPQQVLDYGEAVRALLKADPSLTVAELVRRTRAPVPLVTLVRRRWRQAAAERIAELERERDQLRAERDLAHAKLDLLTGSLG